MVRCKFSNKKLTPKSRTHFTVDCKPQARTAHAQLQTVTRNLKVTGSLRGGRSQTICSSPFFSHRKYASEIKLSRHKAGMVDNMQTNHHYSSSHCSRCTLVKSVTANYSPKISSAKTASKSILLLGALGWDVSVCG